jgi:hypothetical protein
MSQGTVDPMARTVLYSASWGMNEHSSLSNSVCVSATVRSRPMHQMVKLVDDSNMPM